MKPQSRIGFILVAFVLLVSTGNTAVAQEDETAALEEVIVTAQKREQSLQDVPISIVAVSGASLRDWAVDDLNDLSQSIPNLHISTSFAQGYLSVRGMSSGINPGFESTVGLVIDGIFYPRNRFSRLAFLDLERIEILKGPQGAVIGKNTTAGAINITTARPTDEFTGWGEVTAEVEGDEGYTVQGAVSGPLGETLKGRLAVRYDDHDGFMENPFTGEDVPEREESYARGTLLWEPSDALTVTGTFGIADLVIDGRNIELISCDQPFIDLLTGAGLKQFEDCEPNHITGENFERPALGSGQFNTQDTEAAFANVNIDWHTPIGTLSALTGYSDYEFFGENSGLRTILAVRAVDLGEDYEQFSEEIRLTSNPGGTFDYIVGGYYLHAEQDTFTAIHIFGPQLSAPIYAFQDSDTWAAFGQLTYHATETLDLTVEGRYTDEQKDIHMFETFSPLFNIDVVNLLLYDITLDRSESEFTPGANVVWQPTDDTMFFASYREGFKGGGYNHFLNTSGNDTARLLAGFEPESSESFELGTKLTLAGGRAQLNFTLFHTEYEDLQVTTNIPVGALAAFAVKNAAKATTQGAEMELRWRPAAALLLGVRAAYLDAEYDSFPNSQCYIGQTPAAGCVDGVQDLSGAELPFSPDWSATADAEYTWVLRNGWELFAYGEVIYNDDQWVEFVTDPVQLLDSYVKFNARLGLRTDTGWEFAVIGRNLNDETTFTGANQINFSSGGTALGMMDPPRAVSLQARYSF